MRLLNKNAIITGGAKGIGKATAIKMLKEGARVTIADDDEMAGNELVKQLSEKKYDITAIKCNITIEENVYHLFKEVYSSWGRIDILINNAGIWDATPLEQISEATFQKVVDVNFKGSFLCCKHVIPYFRKNKEGTIINIASVAAMVGGSHSSLYVASKHALIGLTRSLVADYARENIRVNAVCPGLVETELFADLLKSYSKSDDPDKVKERLIIKYPVGRFGTPSEIANVVAFIASDEASFMHGSIVVVDGGRTTV